MQGLPRFTNTKFAVLSGLRLFLATDLRSVGEYRRMAKAFLHQHLAAEHLTDDLVVVIDEALTNVIRHSYAGVPDHTLQLQMMVETQEESGQTHLTIIIVDQGDAGKGYSPSDRLAENLANMAAGATSGYGLMLIYRIMDKVEYKSTPQGENRLVLHKSYTDGQPDETYLSRLIHDLQDVGVLTPA
jgi:serine/threonine-protein kinase RsbW